MNIFYFFQKSHFNIICIWYMTFYILKWTYSNDANVGRNILINSQLKIIFSVWALAHDALQCLCFSFSPSREDFGQIGKRYFPVFVHLLLWERVTRIGVNNMICGALSTHVLEKLNSNGGLKQGHPEVSSSTTKNISPLPPFLWPPNLAGP